MSKLNKEIVIYKVYWSGTGDEIFVDYRPTKNDLLKIAQQEDWCYDDDDRKDQIKCKEILSEKIKIYGK